MYRVFEGFKKHHWTMIALLVIPLLVSTRIGGIWSMISVGLYGLIMVVMADAFDRSRKIYTLTGVSGLRPRVTAKGRPYESRDYSLFGYYSSELHAREEALANTWDINEAGWNQYLVIEEVPRQGVYPQLRQVQWYEWIQEGEFAGEGHYVEIEPPADVAFDVKSGIKFSNFGMG